MIPRGEPIAGGDVRISGRPETIVAIAIVDQPGHWNGVPVKDLYVRFAGVKRWFLAGSPDLETICRRP